LITQHLAGGTVSAQRLTLNFNPDWKFLKADHAGAAATEFDDRAWSAVSLPHTYNDVDAFAHWSLPGHKGQMEQWSGRTWYRKTFTPPESWRGKKVYIEFDAARQIAEIYLNGELLGVSRTGFIPFGFDLTPRLHIGRPNVLAVMCDNRFTQETEMAKIAATEIPWNSPHWHPAHGGLYRNVYIHVTDPLHISLPLYSFLATAGPYVYASDITDRQAMVNVEVPVENGRKSPEKIEVHCTVLDRDGRAVLEIKKDEPIAADLQSEFKLSGTLENPHRWNLDSPYLYRVVCSLSVGGRLIDSCEVPLGIRTVKWDAQTGFFINGRQMKLHGWGQKPTDEWPGLGAAQPDWMHFYTLELMKEAGGNFVRWGHCAGGPASIIAGDRLGIIADQPGVDGEGDARGSAWTLRAAAFRDTIIYFRNHPSILIWEGGNQKVSRAHAKELRGLMDRFDPHGGRVYAHRRADKTTAEFMDIGIGTEGGREIKQLPVVEGEYDREESPRRIWDDFSPPNFGYPEAKGQTYQLTSEQYAANEVSQYVEKLGKANHCGGANWIFSDSTSGGRVSCEVCRAGGEVDGVRLPKEAYYVCRVMFRPEPLVHIIGHWTYPPGTKKTVYVASNTDAVELFINGRSLGRGKVSDRYLFTFPDVAWEPGEIRAVGYVGDKPVVSESKHTVGPAVALRMTPITGPGGLRADGSDVALIDVEAVDSKGERFPTFQKRVDFETEGSATWRGGYNSGKINSVNNPYLDLECGINRVAVRAGREPGQIVVRARCEGLKPASIAIVSFKVPTTDGMTTVLPGLPNVDLSKASKTDVTGRGATDAGNMPAERVGRFINSLSYSGPTKGVRIESGLKDDKQVYIDRKEKFAGLPAELRGGDYVQAASADHAYSAVDLMEVAVKGPAVAYVAHDDRLPRPEWLTKQFKPGTTKLTVAGHEMTLFRRQIAGEESLTLGSNAEEAREGNMYVVIVMAPRTVGGEK
jgi:beta-galactosidase